MHQEQQQELRKIDSKTIGYMRDWISSYSQQELNNIEIICFDKKIYVLLTIYIRVLDWYHSYLNHTGGRRLVNTI